MSGITYCADPYAAGKRLAEKRGAGLTAIQVLAEIDHWWTLQRYPSELAEQAAGVVDGLTDLLLRKGVPL